MLYPIELRAHTGFKLYLSTSAGLIVTRDRARVRSALSAWRIAHSALPFYFLLEVDHANRLLGKESLKLVGHLAVREEQ